MSESLRTMEKELQDQINKMVNVEKKVETHYLNGQIKEQGQLVKGKRHGVWKEYYENGNLKLKEQYIAGGLNGTRKEYFEDGKMKSEFNFKNNKYNGYQKQYDNQGKLLIEGEYSNDKLHGDVKYYENGELYLIEKYSEDKKIGEQKMKETSEKVIGKKTIEKLKDGTYKVELWHNEIAFERAIYPNENIDDYTPLERKIYENNKLYSMEYFSYEKNEKVRTVYDQDGHKKLKSTKNSKGIVIDNYFKGIAEVENREYREINTYELKKEEIFKEGIENIPIREKSYNESGELIQEKVMEYEKVGEDYQIKETKVIDYENEIKSEEKIYDRYKKIKQKIEYYHFENNLITQVNEKVYNELEEVVKEKISDYTALGTILREEDYIRSTPEEKEVYLKEEKIYYENGGLKEKREYENYKWISEDGSYEEGIQSLPIREKSYDELGNLVREKEMEYEDLGYYGIVNEIKETKVIDYENEIKLEEKIYDRYKKIKQKTEYHHFENNLVKPVNEKVYNELGEVVKEKISNYTTLGIILKEENYAKSNPEEKAIYLTEEKIYDGYGELKKSISYENNKLMSEREYGGEDNKYFNQKNYRENGTIESEGTFNLEDEKHGKWKEYDINGNLKLEETYKDGKLDGVSKKIITLGEVVRDIQTTYENGEIKQQEEKEYDKDNKLAIKVVKDYQNNRLVFNETIQYKEEKEHSIERVKYEYDENNVLRKEEKNIFEYDPNELEEILVGGYLRKYNEKEELLQDIPLSLEEEEPTIKREEALPIQRTVYPKDGVKYFYFLEKQGESIDVYRTEHSLDNPDLLIKESNLENRVYVGAVESLEAGVKLINQKYKDDREENYSKVFDNMKKGLTPEDVQVAKELLKRLYPDDDLEKESKDYLKQNYRKVEGLYIRKEENIKNENTVIKDYLENGVMYALLNNIDKTMEKAELKMPVDLTNKEVTRVVEKDEKNNIKEVKVLNKITGEIESEKTLFYDKDNNLYRSHEFSNGVQRIKEYDKGVLKSEVIKDKENELKQKFNEKGELIEKTLVNLKMKNNKLTQKYENNVLTSETLNLGKRKSFFNIEYSKSFDKNGNILNEKYREGNTIKDIKDDVRNKINSVIDKIKTYAYIKFFGKELADIIVKHQEEKNKKSLNLEEIKLSNYVSTKNIAGRFSKLAMGDTYYPNDVNKFKNVQSEKIYKENTLVNEEISEKGIRTVKEFKHKDNILVGEIYKEYKGQELLSKEEIDFENNKKSIKTFFKDGEIYLTKEKETREDNNKKEFNYEKDTYYDSKTGNINKIVEVETKDNNEKIKSQEFNDKGILIEENNYLNDELENRKIYVENRLDKEILIENGLKKQREYNLDETLKKEIITRGEEVKTEEFEYQDGKKVKSEVKLERNGELEVREIRSYQNEEIQFREQTRYEDGLEIKSKYNSSNNLIEQIRDNEVKTIEYYKSGELSEKGYDTYKETFKRNGELVREVTGSKIQKDGESEVTKLYEKGELKLEEIKYNKDFKLNNSVKKIYERGTVVKEEKREFSNGKEISCKEEVSSTTIKLVQKSQSQDTGIER